MKRSLRHPGGGRDPVFAFIVFLLLAFSAYADDFESTAERWLISAKSGDPAAYHELFLMTDQTDGALTEILGSILVELRASNPKRYKKLLKKEPRRIREQVEFHTAVAAGEPED